MLVAEYESCCFGIQETFLHNGDTLHLPGFDLYQLDVPAARSAGGVLLVVKACLALTQVSLPTALQAVAGICHFLQ